MLSETKGIILHTVKFGENSVIATAYTEKFGRQSYIINSTHSKNSANKVALLLPLTILQLIVYHKETREIQRIKEFRTAFGYRTIPFDVNKSSQAIFIAEVLFKLLREEESNPELFDFIEDSLFNFDLMVEGTANFHLYFLAKLTHYLGIQPLLNQSKNDGWIDFVTGTEAESEPYHPKFMTPGQTRLFTELITTSVDQLPTLIVNRQDRQEFLPKIVEFYKHHFDTMGDIKSISVLKEVFG
jgi:DNA repair protein RecO (recombination protein O)